jgi:uncharacterized protein (DUF58 family)
LPLFLEQDARVILKGFCGHPMFSENWAYLTMLLLVISALAGHRGLLLVTLLMATATSLAWLWNHFVLRRVEYARDLMAGRAFVGERVAVSVTLTNRKTLPVPWLKVDDAFPDRLPLVDRELNSSSTPGRAFLTHLASLGPYERVRWSYEIDCNQRGFFFFGPCDLSSGDMFGFFSQLRRFRTPGRLIVYPRVQPLPELGFPGKDPFGEERVMRHIVEDPTYTVGVREYHPQDTIKRIHWKASARHGDLKVKVYQPTITQQLVIFLNVTSFAKTWMGIIPERQEQAISVAASIAHHATERRFAVGLIANGSVPHSDQPIKVLPSRAPEQLTRILEALAAVTGFGTADIEKLLTAQSSRLALGATLVVVTTIVTDGLLAEMLRLRDAGRRLVLVSMDPEFRDQGPSGITTYHIPLAEIDFAGVWTRATAGEELSRQVGRKPLPRARSWWSRGRYGDR